MGHRLAALVIAGSFCVGCASGPLRTDEPKVFWTTVLAEVLKGLLSGH